MRHWNLSEEGKYWHGILCGCEGALVRALWRSVTLKLHKRCCLWGKNFQHDSPLALIKSWFSETKITWKCAYPLWFPQEGRAGSGTGELGWFVETSLSLKHHLHFPFSHMGRLQISGGFGGHQEEGIPGSGSLMLVRPNHCSLHRAVWPGGFSHTSSSSCFVQEMPDSHSTKHEEMPLFPRTRSVLESRMPLKEMGVNRGVGFSFSFYRTKLGLLLLPRSTFWKLK